MEQNEMAATPEARPILGAHHAAYRCRDAEQTIWFYRDVLGLPASGITLDEVTGTGEHDPYMHLFFKMKNGDYIAFFDAPASADPAWFARKPSFDMHLAFEVADEAEMAAMQERINAFGISALGPVDHGMVKSVYMYDPNGIQVEVTVRTAQHDAIFAEEDSKFAETLKAWTARTRAQKEAKFGAAAIDQRSRQKSVAGA
jgi:catechol 2,3-dioxygenase-like lactoylglutathione lyase family enzyme